MREIRSVPKNIKWYLNPILNQHVKYFVNELGNSFK